MKIDAVGLTVELIPAELEPLETFVDGIERNLGVPFDVSIIDAQNYYAALVAGIEPIKDECSSAAYVKVAGRRRRKAHTCHTWSSKNKLNGTSHEDARFYQIIDARPAVHLKGWSAIPDLG